MEVSDRGYLPNHCSLYTSCNLRYDVNFLSLIVHLGSVYTQVCTFLFRSGVYLLSRSCWTHWRPGCFSSFGLRLYALGFGSITGVGGEYKPPSVLSCSLRYESIHEDWYLSCSFASKPGEITCNYLFSYM